MTTNVKQLQQNQLLKEVTINENFSATSVAAKFAWMNPSTTGLTFQVYGGTMTNSLGVLVNVSNKSLTLTASKVNYVEYDIPNNNITFNVTAFTNGFIPLYKVTTDSTKITAVDDERVSALIPLGVSPSLSGSGGGSGDVKEFGLFTLINSSISDSTQKFKVNGGFAYGANSEFIELNVADYIHSTYLVPNTAYYIYIRNVSNSSNIMVVDAANLQGTNVFEKRLLYKFTTDSTKIATITDLRDLNVKYYNNFFIQSMVLEDAKNDYQFIFNNLGSHSVNLNTSTAISTTYPRYTHIHLCLVCCVNSANGYVKNDEVDYVTYNDTFVGGKPYTTKQDNNQLIVNAYKLTNLKVLNKTTKVYETPVSANYILVCKVYADYR